MSEKEALQVQKMIPIVGDLLVRDSALAVTLGFTGIQGQWSIEKAKKKLSHAVEQLLRAAKGELQMAPPGLDWGEARKGRDVYEFVGVTLDKVDPHSEHVITKKWLQDHLRGFKTNFRRGAEILARFPEGEPVDVPTYLKEHGNPEAADRWTVMHEQHKDRFKNQPEGPETPEKTAMSELERMSRRMPVEMVFVQALPLQGYWHIGSRLNDVEMPLVSFEKGTQVFQGWLKQHQKAAQRLTRLGDHPEIQFALNELGMSADDASRAYTAAVQGWAKAKTPQQFAAATKKLPGGDLLGALGRAKVLPQSYSDRMISFLDGQVSLTNIPKGQRVYASEKEADTMSAMTELEKLAACGDNYKDEDGSFKGGPGDAFDNCVKFMQECRDDVDDPEALCAWIGREHGKIKASEFAQAALEVMSSAKITWPEFVRRAKTGTWETGHIDEDDELPEGEGSLIPGLEERRGSEDDKDEDEKEGIFHGLLTKPKKRGETILAFVEPDDDMDESEMIVITAGFLSGPGVPDGTGPWSGHPECPMSQESEPDGSELPGDEMVGRFEEGKPADPCENMSKAECDEWKANTEKYKDKFDKGAMDELERMATDKTAISQETSDFVEWAINQEPMTKQETIRMLKTAGLKEILPPRQKRTGPRFQQKDEVLIKAHKHSNPATVEPYKEHDGQVGTVVGLEGDGVFVQFRSGQPVLFPDAQKTRGVGIYKYTPAFVMEGSKKLELIYESGGKTVNPDRILVVEQYLGRGRTVKRKAPYFTGHAFNARYNKQGGVYFTLFPQQRIAVNPEGGTTEAGFEATSINPDVGKLYYMGLFGRRPSGWEVDLQDMRAGKMVMAAARMLERMACGDELMSRFEEGVPADPCENMTDAECEEWRNNTEKYKDKFDKKQAAMVKTAGYTNYWNIKEPFTPEEWNVITLAALKAWDMGRRMKKIPDKSPVWKRVYADYVAQNGVVLKGQNGSGRPQITDDLILFNGDGSARVSVELDADTSHPWTYESDLAHEDFYFVNEKGRSFCKTERKPYDMAVASVLWWAKKIAPKKIDIGSDDGKPIKIFATDKEAIADVSERAFDWFREVAETFEKIPWSKAIDGLGKAISNKGRAEDVLDDFTDLDKAKMNALLSVGGEKKLKKWLQDAFKKHGSMDEIPARERMTQREGAEKWIPDDLERGRCTPAPNPDCPVGSPQYNLAQTFKKHKEWGEKGRKNRGKKARERMTQRRKEAAREPGGLYGFTKKIQADCETAARKLAKAALVTAKAAYTKDERVARFLATHAERSGSLSAQILVKAMQEIGPRIAAETKKQARLEELRAQRGVKTEKQAKEPEGKTAGNAKYGLYGYKAKTATLGLNACNSIREEAGRIASDLHGRRADKHAGITDFLKNRSKRGRCLYSRMLVRSYPDAEMKIASAKPGSVQEWLAWED